MLRLFLVESILLAGAGAALGVLIASITIAAARQMFPLFPIAAPTWAPLAAVGVAVVTGLLFGVLPARRAARLDPVRALTGR